MTSVSGSFSEWTPRRVVQATLIVAGIALLFYLVFVFRFVIFTLFTAILLSTAIRPASEWLQRIGLSRTFSTALVFAITLVLVAGFIVGLVPIFSEAGTAVVQSLRVYYHNVRTMLLESPSGLIRQLTYSLPWTISTELPAEAGQAGEQTLLQAFSLAGQAIQFLLIGLAVMLLTFFWSLEREKAVLSISRYIPSEQRSRALDFFYEMESSVGSYLRGVLLLSVAVGTLALVAYLIIGLPNAIFLGLVAGVMEAVPMIGPILGAIPAVLIAIMFAPDKVIWVILATFIIQTAENYLLVPRVMRHAAGVNSFVTLLALAAFGSLFGLAGALLAIPLAVVIQLVVQRFLIEPRIEGPPELDGRDYTSKLRYEAQELAQDIRKIVRRKEDDLERETDELEETIEVLANDLDSILAALPRLPEKEAL